MHTAAVQRSSDVKFIKVLNASCRMNQRALLRTRMTPSRCSPQFPMIIRYAQRGSRESSSDSQRWAAADPSRTCRWYVSADLLKASSISRRTALPDGSAEWRIGNLLQKLDGAGLIGDDLDRERGLFLDYRKFIFIGYLLRELRARCAGAVDTCTV